MSEDLLKFLPEELSFISREKNLSYATLKPKKKKKLKHFLRQFETTEDVGEP